MVTSLYGYAVDRKSPVVNSDEIQKTFHPFLDAKLGETEEKKRKWQMYFDAAEGPTQKELIRP